MEIVCCRDAVYSSVLDWIFYTLTSFGIIKIPWYNRLEFFFFKAHLEIESLLSQRNVVTRSKLLSLVFLLQRLSENIAHIVIVCLTSNLANTTVSPYVIIYTSQVVMLVIC